MPARHRPLSRRLVLTGGIGVAAASLTACDLLEDVLGGGEGPGVSGAVTPTAPPADDDSTLVAEILAAISTTGALATATAAAVPGLARTAGRLARIHRAHAAELGGTLDAPAPQVAGPRAAALAALIAAEAQLRDRLVAAARQAHSGALAQVLAAMAASLAQVAGPPEGSASRTGTPTPSTSATGTTPPATDPDLDPTTVALQTTLAAEHAAVFVYGVLGGQTSQSGSPLLYAAVTSAYDVHRTRRDDLTARLHAVGAEPVAAEPGYAVPGDLGIPAAVSARARALEEAAATTYAYLVASTTGDARAWAIDALVDAAVRGLGFGGRPDRLPGL